MDSLVGNFVDVKGRQVNLPTEYNHYEGAVAYTLNLPLLVLVHEEVGRRVVFDPSYRGHVGVIPANATTKWLQSKEFKTPMNYWREELNERRDVTTWSSKRATSVQRRESPGY